MNVQVDDFSELVKQEWDYPQYDEGNDGTSLVIKAADADVSGGKVCLEEIDRLASYPDAKSVTIFGLTQEAFEYFITKYGKQFRYINFFKDKRVEDWSLLSTLPELEGLYWYHNQKITKLWDMSRNYALMAVELSDFTRLHDISGIEKAPALEWFGFGDAIWSTSNIDSLKPLLGTKIKRICFYGKKINDMDISFIPELKDLEVFDFPTNLFTTEEVAWLMAKCPKLQGYSLKPYIQYESFSEKTRKTDVPAVIIIGKRKPSFIIEGNEDKLDKYVKSFNELVEKYKTE